MKVLLISSSSGSQGGGEFYLVLLAQGLVGLGCCVSVVMSDAPHMNELESMLLPICEVRRIKLTNTYRRRLRGVSEWVDRRELAGIKKAIEGFGPDIVHINKQCVDDGLNILTANSATGVPAVVTVHVTKSMASLNAFLGRVRDLISMFIVTRSAVSVIVVSEQSRRDWKRMVAKHPIFVVPNGTTAVCTDFRGSIRKRWSVSDENIVLGTVARIEDQKNPLFLPKVIAALPRNVHMVWIGDGRMRKELELEIARQSVADRFHLLGWQKNARDLICGLDIFVLPSLYEGFPFAILEAMSANLPCVVSDVDGNGESVIHEKTGLVLPVNNHERWVSELGRLVSERALIARFGAAAKIRFEQEYTLEAMAARTMRVYRNVLDKQESIPREIVG